MRPRPSYLRVVREDRIPFDEELKAGAERPWTARLALWATGLALAALGLAWLIVAAFGWFFFAR